MATETETAGLRPLEKAALLRSQLADKLADDFAAMHRTRMLCASFRDNRIPYSWSPVDRTACRCGVCMLTP
jgi:hypothetical protein